MGIGCRAGAGGFPVFGRARLLALGRSLRGGRRRFALADGPPGVAPADPGVHERHGRHRRADAADQVRHECRPRSACATRCLLAKQCATIDVLSEGRLLPAFGVGSPRGPEWQVRGEASDKGARRTNEGAGNPLPALVGGKGQLRGRVLRHEGRLDLAAPGAGPAAAMDRRVEPGRDPPDRQMGHGLAGGGGGGAGGRGAGRGRDPRGRRGRRPAVRPPSISAPG